MDSYRFYITIANVWFAAGFVMQGHPNHAYIAHILGFVWLGLALWFALRKE